jgi:predicted O-methyltransferase YrrM
MTHAETADNEMLTSDDKRPPTLDAIERDSRAAGFSMASEPETGSLLRALAASKPAGGLLELGTGTGIATAWILDGMDAASTLLTVEGEGKYVEIVRRHLGGDPRVTFCVEDGAAFLARMRGRSFDFIFADTWPGKFDHLEEALGLLRRGGLYVIDDLLPQPNWPEGHGPKVDALVADLEQRPDLVVSRLAWSSGLIVAAKR